jgi:tetratricopeptide (TPR) repeat protein
MIRILLLMAITGAATAAPDALSRLGLRATEGAAPGYLPDTACAQCHQAIAASYAEVGMAQSFAAAGRNAAELKLDAARYTHPLTGQTYRLDRRDGQLWFTQTQPASAADRAHQLELRVDWVLGSGHRAQSFVHQTAAGELYQLPVTWYAEKQSLAMSPGYEGRDHAGVERRLRRECMFCHNAYPEVALGSDMPGQPDLYPQQLPQGIGCQRCHGPGAAHLRAVLEGRGLAAIHAAITNPAKLSWPQRNDVCFQCHLLPAVEMIGARRAGRGDYSFRPGERLSDYLVHAEIDDDAMPQAERFQINHHGYRLLQSACYLQSQGEMGCVTCHDPHVRRVGAAAVGWYREKCLHCHTGLSAEHGRAENTPKSASDDRDCVRCHMPRRRTQDVVEASVTDHRIARGPFDAGKLLAARAPHRPEISDLQLFNAPASMPSAEAAAYRALIALNNGSGVAATSALAQQLAKLDAVDASWWLQLTRYQVAHRQYPQAKQSLALLPPAQRTSAPALELAAMIEIGNGRIDAGAAGLRRLTRGSGFRPEAHYNLGLLERQRQHPRRSIAALQRTVEQRPLSAAAWYQLARTLWTQEDIKAALQSLDRAQAIKPDFAEARNLRAQIESDRNEEAVRQTDAAVGQSRE